MKKIFIIVSIFVLIFFTGFLIYKEGTLPVNKNAKTSQIFVIKKGESLNSIINNLSSSKLIRSRVVFYWVVKQLGIEREIQAGDFKLSQSMSAESIAKELTHGSIDVWVTVLEGKRKEEVAEIMSVEFGISETEFNQLAKEGYLFPDTYLIPKAPSVEQIISIMENNFNNKYTASMRKKAQAKGFTDLELLTFASIIEKETTLKDRKQIANILYKRYKENYPLQVDATVQYALGYQLSEKRWWKKFTTFEDLKYDSKYNTYKYKGLPPGPICSPSLSSINAILEATGDTAYMFYLHDTKGNSYFAKTYEEHLENTKKYLR